MESSRFHQHDLVTRRDGDGSVGFVLSAEPSLHAGERWYRVQFGASGINCRESDLQPHSDAPDIAELLSTDAYGGPNGLRRHVTAVKLKSQLTDTLYSFGASRTRLYPYQFIPLLKFLSSPYRRILIADEVGLGKTIEAGYILREELARGRLARVLVVCPASLRLKWQDELFNRFSHRFDILDAAQARHRIPLSEGERRTAHPLRAIVSLQSIRNERFIQSVLAQETPLDLLIVDEVHHCRNPRTLQSQAVSALVEQADSVTFLSATPIQTSELNLFTLLNVLLPEEFPSEAAFRQRLRLNEPIVLAETFLRQQGQEAIQKARTELERIRGLAGARAVTDNPLFDDLLALMSSDGTDSPTRRVEMQERLSEINLLSNIFTRTKRRDVELNVARRKPIIPNAKLTDYEQEVYDLLSLFIFKKYEEFYDQSIARLVLVTYQRQIASSIPAAVRKFLEAIEDQESKWNDEIETLDENEDEDSADLDEIRFRPIDDPEFRQIVRGIDLDRLESEDTKYPLLRDALLHQQERADHGERTTRKVIVFSYFRRSLDYLERRLAEDDFSFVRIDGSVKSTPGNPDTDERHHRITRFRDDDSVDVLLTSEVGSEGLDFQFCDSLVNWDLPWNPMVVEQRIGRLDRIGQQSPSILVINLACKGTIEARILQRLYTRIGIFEHSIGELEPILGRIVRELESQLFRPGLSVEEQERVLHEREVAVENQRRQHQALEQQAEQLIGHDEFFKNKLDRIRRFGRYVGGVELRLFVENELQHAVPGLQFGLEDRAGVFTLPHRSQLESLLDKHLPRGDEELYRFLTRLRDGTLRVTFDGEIADQYPDTEPLHAHHPLVRALAARLNEDQTLRSQVARLRVASPAVPPGPWFFVWSVVTETGFFAARSLMCCVVDLRNDELAPIENDAGDQLLADMLRAGRSWPDFNPPEPQAARHCLEAAEDRIRQRVDELHKRRSARMKAIQAARRSSVEATFRFRISRQRERILEFEERALRDERIAQILPAVRGRLRQLEAERDTQLDHIDGLKLGTVTYVMLGAGFVDVTKESAESEGNIENVDSVVTLSQEN